MRAHSALGAFALHAHLTRNEIAPLAQRRRRRCFPGHRLRARRRRHCHLSVRGSGSGSALRLGLALLLAALLGACSFGGRRCWRRSCCSISSFFPGGGALLLRCLMPILRHGRRAFLWQWGSWLRRRCRFRGRLRDRRRRLNRRWHRRSRGHRHTHRSGRCHRRSWCIGGGSHRIIRAVACCAQHRWQPQCRRNYHQRQHCRQHQARPRQRHAIASAQTALLLVPAPARRSISRANRRELLRALGAKLGAVAVFSAALGANPGHGGGEAVGRTEREQ